VCAPGKKENIRRNKNRTLAFTDRQAKDTYISFLLFQHIGVEIHRKHTQKVDGNMFGMTLVEEEPN